MQTAQRIGLIFDVRYSFSRSEMRGAIAYARDRGLAWEFAGGADVAATWAMLRRWWPHGLLVATGSRRRLGSTPRVGVLAPESGASAVLDNAAIGALAAHHLLERGFFNLGFVGERGMRWSDERGAAFEAAWRKAYDGSRDAEGGRRESSFHRLVLALELDSAWRPAESQLHAWLAQLPRPVGILGCRDLRAREVAQACRDLGLRVPDEVAIVGVDNDDLLCELSDPPLSSVSVPWERIGYYMAAHLDRLMGGRSPPRRLPVVGPGPLAVRRSSDAYATTDEAVVRACRYISENAARAIGVEDVARAAGVSRRGLERRFRRELGRSPLHDIRRARLDLVRRLLRDTPLTLAAIAERAGFATGERLSTVFKTHVGHTPGQYRASYRPREGPFRARG